MSLNLKDKTINGLFWSFLERTGLQLSRFIISIILARLLLPREFGLIAMIWIFISIGQVFIYGGYARALIQKQNVTYIDVCSVFYFNVFMGICFTLLLCFASPYIALFYNQPYLVPIICVLSFSLIIDAFTIVQTVLFVKKIDFKTQLKINLTAAIGSGILGISMAFTGFGVWSLVGQKLMDNLIKAILTWMFSSWRPGLIFSFESLTAMFPFASSLLISGLLGTIFNNLYIIVIGKFFSPAKLGFYTRANKLQELPSLNLSLVVSHVIFPVFSAIQDDGKRMLRGIRRSLALLAMVNFPMMIGLAVVARPFIVVLLTEKWLPSVSYLQLLCIAGMLYPLCAIHSDLLNAQGRSDLFLRLQIIKNILMLFAVFITYKFGIKVMILGQIIISLISYLLNSYYTWKILDYSFLEQVKDIYPFFLLSVLMGLVMYLYTFLDLSDLVLLILQITSGVLLYCLCCYFLRLSAFSELLEMLKSKLLGPCFILRNY